MPPESHNLLNFLQSVTTWCSTKYISPGNSEVWLCIQIIWAVGNHAQIWI